MESGDDDIFAISDEEISLLAQPALNPVEEHLLNQMSDVVCRIHITKKEIAETKATSARILNALEKRAIHGEDASSDSDSEMYTVEGVPIIKKQKCSRNSNTEKILEIVSQWQCILQDKWIIGIELLNKSCCTLLDPRCYPYVLSTLDEEISGESTFWKLEEECSFHSERISSIQPGAAVATMVLDLPTFDQKSVVECWGIISYKIDETQYQIPVTPIRLSIAETINSSCMKFLNENEHGAILALKGTSIVEKIVNVQFSRNEQDNRDENRTSNKKLFHFLTTRTFAKIYGNVFLIKEHGSLMYCLIEVLLIDVNEANIRIFARSVNQLNIILHLLQDEFSNVTVVEETNECIEAALALIHELEMIRDKKSIREIQEAKVITDLLIP